jgi:hypothetical protein
MPHFKAPGHSIPFFLNEDDIAEGLLARLPVGSVEISDEEADDMRKLPPPTVEEQNAIADAQRAAAYRDEADPLFFKFQRGDATKEQWLASIEAIKARFPKV